MNSSIPASTYCKKVFDGTHSTPKPVGAGFPLVTSKNILENSLDLSDTYNISETDYKEIQRRSQVSKWDVLFSMIGTVGEIYLEKNDTIPYAIKNVGVFSCEDEYKAKWLFYYLKSPLAKKIIRNYLNGAVQKFLPLEALRDFPIAPFDEKNINGIDLLCAVDEKIHLNNCINKELEQMSKTIYNYWFVQFDFPNEEGKPYKESGGEMEWNEKLKMEIPIGWTDGKLSEVANITMGQSPDGDSYNEEGEGMVFFQGSTDFNFRFPLVRMFTTAPSRIAQEQDVLLSVRAPVGTLNVANEKCCIGRGLAALNSKHEANSFVLYLMFYFKAMFDVQNRTGTTFGSIDKDTLYDLKFAKPPVDLQKQFQNIVGKYDKMILTRSRETQELITLRDFLLPLLMNGQVKVG